MHVKSYSRQMTESKCDNKHYASVLSRTCCLGHDDLDVFDWPVVIAVKTRRLVDGDGLVGNHGDVSSDNHHLGFLGGLSWG